MRNRNHKTIALALLCCSASLTCGCFDAVTRGLTAGLSDGITAVIEQILLGVVTNFSAGP